MSVQQKVLIYGGRGALGRTCVQYFRQRNWWVGSIDLVKNEEANGNVIITSDSLLKQEEEVVAGVKEILKNSKVDAIICVAGGWAGGNSSSNDFIKNSDLMIRQSVWSSLIASKLAANFMNKDGLLTLTGAKAALSGTPGMIGYGLAKAAVHHLVKSLAENNSGLPEGATALAILPVTLDTVMNRKFMPKGDFTTWTPLDYVAERFFDWANNKERPASGSLVQLVTEKSETTMIIE